jgi:Icc-related predicted phosphoesterase
MRLGRRRSDDADRTVRLFYASDIHGSDLLWRKFLGASKFYGADASVMGGDLLAKAIVPIERRPDGTFRAEFLGHERNVEEGRELDELVGAIRFNGYYPWIASREEIEDRSADTDELFGEVARDEVRRWTALAEEKASTNGLGSSTLFVMAGNDDPWYVDDILAGSAGMVFCDDRIVRVGPHEMISSSYANPTPWNSPRELDEDALYSRLKSLAEQLEDPSRSIFNLHVPPYDSRLDTGPDLKPDLTPRYSGGQPVMKPVGSHAVRRLIEEFQPLLALHGHIHESKGETRIGRTLALNSGSEYNTGRLHGVVVTMGDERVVSHQFVVG